MLAVAPIESRPYVEMVGVDIASKEGWVAVGSELHTKLLLGRMVERSFGVL